MKSVASLWLGVLCLVAVTTRADNIPDLFLHGGVSLKGEWKMIVDPYESGFYDYRWSERDKDANPSRAETFYLDV